MSEALIKPAITPQEMEELAGQLRHDVYVGLQDYKLLVAACVQDRELYLAFRRLARIFRNHRTLIEVR